MALRSIDLLAVPGQDDPYIMATLEAIRKAPRNWKRFTVPGSKPFPGLHPRAKTPIRSLPMLLTNTSKMPCPSWGLPAGKACPGAKYGEGSICGQCYAAKGNYGVPMVQHALQERFKWTLAMMRTPAGQDAFVEYMTLAIQAVGSPYFRVHDSGDLFSPTYARCWARIARNLSHVRFWFPTRSYRIPNLLPAIQDLAALPTGPRPLPGRAGYCTPIRIPVSREDTVGKQTLAALERAVGIVVVAGTIGALALLALAAVMLLVIH